MEKIDNEKLTVADARKQSHLDLALDAQSDGIDNRFYYEPMLSGHPNAKQPSSPIPFGKKELKYPIWISSMTGGTSVAGPLNRILAKTAGKYGLGMGLGSCRIILEDNTYFEDFNLRPILGDASPLFANIGIAQAERLTKTGKTKLLKQLVERLDADGLIIHVNPLQEWLQPEGDFIEQAPIETIKQILNELNLPIIVKEVGQGFGPQSMEELLKLPLFAIDFAANGGTNFSKLELLRNNALKDYYQDVIALGHSAEEMVGFLNKIVLDLGKNRQCNQVVISGGIKSFLDGYYFINQSKIPAIYGQAAPFLKQANISQEALDNYTEIQIKGLIMAQKFLKIKS